MMTAPERAIYNALNQLGIEFTFQSSMLGGREQRGGAVVDFLVASLRLIIRCVGEYWHSRSDTKAMDELHKIALETTGWRVIDIMATDALRNPLFFVSEAIRGVSHARQL